MKTYHLLLPAVLLVTLVASGQDWQDCKPDGSYSFRQLKGFIHSMTTLHMYTGWEVKGFNRSGDLASVAILQTLDDTEMTSPEKVQDVLAILHDAFACPHRCVRVIEDRQPRVALLLLEHLHKHTRGKMQSNVDETTKFVLEQARGVE